MKNVIKHGYDCRAPIITIYNYDYLKRGKVIYKLTIA